MIRRILEAIFGSASFTAANSVASKYHSVKCKGKKNLISAYLQTEGQKEDANYFLYSTAPAIVCFFSIALYHSIPPYTLYGNDMHNFYALFLTI